MAATSGEEPAAIESEAELLNREQVRRVGDFELLEEIARGGMGVVYRARQTSLNRLVAVKMILGGQLATPDSVQRFGLEAEAAANLHHPHIVPIYEIGEEQTQHYFAMKLVEGGSLAGALTQLGLHTVPTTDRAALRARHETIARLMLKVAGAIAYAHQRGVLHRDLKPTNILVDPDGEPHVTDFGLAKVADRESGLTLSHVMLGSPAYMAPEQAVGHAADITTAADVYGLGAVLYELLTGRPPFSGTSAIAVIRQVTETDPIPPTRLNSAVDPDLETICLKCLQKEPANRYSTARLLAEELQRFLKNEPIQARPVSVRERLWRWCRRKPAIAGLSLASLVALAAGFTGVLSQWRRAENSQRLTAAAYRAQRTTINHLEWRGIVSLVDKDHAGRAVAHLAKRLRDTPDNWQTATFAISLLEQHPFALPYGPALDYPADHLPPLIDPACGLLAMAVTPSQVKLVDPIDGREVAGPLHAKAPLAAMAFSPDSTLLATVDTLGTVVFWDTRSARPVRELRTTATHVLQAAFSPSGQTFAVVGDEKIEVWADLAETSPVPRAFPPGNARLTGKGARLLTWSHDRDPIRLWDAADGSLLWTAPATAGVRRADCDAAGERIVFVRKDYEATVWDARSGRELCTISGNSSPITHVLMTPNGRYVAAAFRTGAMRTFSATTGEATSKVMRHLYEINEAGLDPAGERLITGSRDWTARIWDMTTGNPLCESMRTSGYVEQVALSAEGERVMTLSRNASGPGRTIQCWQVRSAQAPWRVQPAGARDLNGVRLSPDGRLAVAGAWSPSPAIHVYDTATGALVFGPAEIQGDAYGIEFTPDLRTLVVATANGWIHAWSMEDWSPLWPSVKQPGPVQPAALSPDGTLLATGSPDGMLRLWSIDSGQLALEMPHGAHIKGLSFSADGTMIVTGGADGRAVVWNVQTGAAHLTLLGHKREILCVGFSPCGDRVLTGSYDATVRLWDAITGVETVPALRHQAEISHAAFNADGRKVATCARDGTARIWAADTGRPLVDWMHHEETVQTVEFHPDGRRLLTRDQGGFRLWDVNLGEPITVHFPDPVTGGLGVDSPTMRQTFSRDGARVFLGGSTDNLTLWEIPQPPETAPAWFPDFLEAAAGLRLGEAGEYLSVSPARFLEFRLHASTEPGSGYYDLWLRKYLGLAGHDAAPGVPTSGQHNL